MKTHLQRHFLRLRSQRGDTIVEVLIAIAVISLVLTGAYGTTRKSLVATRDSQEHSEALKLLEGQIEALRSSDVLSTTTPSYAFCVDPSTPGTLLHTSTPGACTPTSASGAYKYQLSITSAATSGVYNLSATWSTLGGGNSQVNLWYSFQ